MQLQNVQQQKMNLILPIRIFSNLAAYLQCVASIKKSKLRVILLLTFFEEKKTFVMINSCGYALFTFTIFAKPTFYRISLNHFFSFFFSFQFNCKEQQNNNNRILQMFRKILLTYVFFFRCLNTIFS